MYRYHFCDFKVIWKYTCILNLVSDQRKWCCYFVFYSFNVSYGQVLITTACFGGETVNYIYYVIFVYRLELEDGVSTCSEILIMVGTVCDCDSVC